MQSLDETQNIIQQITHTVLLNVNNNMMWNSSNNEKN